MKNDLVGFLQRHANRELLKYSAGHSIFCPKCQTVLDRRSTVVSTIHRLYKGNEAVVFSTVCCARCWTKLGPVVRQVFEDARTITGAKYPGVTFWLEVVTWNSFETTKTNEPAAAS